MPTIKSVRAGEVPRVDQRRAFDPGQYGAELVAQVLLDLEVGEVY